MLPPLSHIIYAITGYLVPQNLPIIVIDLAEDIQQSVGIVKFRPLWIVIVVGSFVTTGGRRGRLDRLPDLLGLVRRVYWIGGNRIASHGCIPVRIGNLVGPRIGNGGGDGNIPEVVVADLMPALQR